jgi:hypothetical protein
MDTVGYADLAGDPERMAGMKRNAGLCSFAASRMRPRLMSRVLVALSLACCLHAAVSGQELNRAGEDKDLVRRRDVWFYGQRAYPLGFIPSGARQSALERTQRMTQLQRMPLAPHTTPVPLVSSNAAVPADAARWKLTGPQPIRLPGFDSYSGRVTALAVDPRNRDVVYLGAAQGGVWKSTDGGVTWAPLTDTQPSLAVGSIALDPSHPDTVYVGTGEQNVASLFDANSDPRDFPFGYSYFAAGILKSTDGGSTWANLASSTFSGPFSAVIGGATIGALAVSATNGQIVLAGVQGASGSASGIYRSTDGGITWTNVLSGGAGTEVLFDAASASVAYAALGSSVLNNAPNGVYKSIDAGQTWTRINGTAANVLPTSSVGRIALAQAPSNAQVLYASLAHEDHYINASLGLFKTMDGGQNWTALTTPNYCPYACDYANVIRVDPVDPDVVFVGGILLFRSTDGGATWTDVGQSLHPDYHALAFAPGGTKIYAGNDGGVWSATQFATPTWTNRNSGLAITQFYAGLSVDPANASHGFGGTQDNGFVRYNGSLIWDGPLVWGDIGDTVIDFSNSSTVYFSYSCGLGKSTANGDLQSFTWPASGISPARCGFLPPLVMDPSNSQTLYFGTYVVYRTTDGAASWTAISPDLTAGCPAGPGPTGICLASISTIAVAPSNSNTVYTGASDGKVQVTTNAGVGAGAVWSDVSAGLPPRAVMHIAVDPTRDGIAYVTFSGFSGFVDTQGHVFRTQNHGVAWTDISANLPNVPVNGIVVDPDVPDALYAATDVGVFASFDGGTVWSTLGSGLPRTAVSGLTLHRASRTLRAGTYGRSAWDLNLNQIAPSGAWIATGNMGTPRMGQTATLLPNGKVLLVGGRNSGNSLDPTATAVVYDPASGTFAPAGSMARPRRGHTATLLPTGKVLVAGGLTTGQGLCDDSAELYDPAANNGAGAFSPAGSLKTSRAEYTATLLPSGKILMAGGSCAGGDSAELYDPAANNGNGVSTVTGSMAAIRVGHTATLLANGKVLVAAGMDTVHTQPGMALDSAELFDPAANNGAGAFAATGSLATARYAHLATLLQGGRVLVTGGLDSTITAVASAEVFDPARGTFTTTGAMGTARYNHSATRLCDGTVLIAGGVTTAYPRGPAVLLASAELYDPAASGGAGAFVPTAWLATTRESHSATLLPDGRVLVAGGEDSSATALVSAELFHSTVCAPINTPTGANVSVQPVDSATGHTPVTVTFASVTQAGTTTLTTSSTGPTPPANFSLGTGLYYDLHTTALFAAPVTVCIDYSGTPLAGTTTQPAFGHFDSTTMTWTMLTVVSWNQAGNVICGTVNSLSPFALFVPSNRPPVADAGPDQTVECGSTATLDGSRSSDPDGDPLTFEWTNAAGDVVGTAPVVTLRLPPGKHTFRLTVRDGKGGTAAAAVTISVRDTTPPRLKVSLSPNVLWPPNHTLVPVRAIVDVNDSCDPSPEVTLVSIVSSESDDDRGEGDDRTDRDDIRGAAFGTDDRSFFLRAERGRVYTVAYRARDAAGNEATASAQVRVGHDGGKRDRPHHRRDGEDR